MAGNRSDRNAQGKHCLPGICLRLKPSWLLLALLVPLHSALAQDARIHRCIGENGEPTFSDSKCTGMATRADPATPPSGAPSASPAPSWRGPATTQTCARSPEDLRARVAAAFAARNGVGLSGLFLWNGFGQGSAVAPLRDLAALIAEPLVSVEIDSYARYDEGDRYSDRAYEPMDDAPLEMVIRTVAEQERRVPYEATSRYGLVELGGCWWLQLPY